VPEYLADGLPVATGDAYTDATTIGPAPAVKQITFSVLGGNSVLVQYWRYTNQERGQWTFEPVEEVYVGQSIGVVLTNCAGVRFRSAVTGLSTTVIAKLSYDDDILASGGAISGVAINSDGTISSTVSNLPVVNVQAFGAKCDGVTDDLGAITKALVQLGTNGVLYLPGICGISNVVDVTVHPGLVIAGPLVQGLGVTFPFIGGLKALPGFPANTPLLKSAPGSVTDIRTLICGISLDGSNLAQDGFLGVNVSGPRSVGVSVRNVLRDGFRVTGGGGNSNTEWIDCYVQGAGDAGYYFDGIFCRFIRAHADGAGNYGIYGAPGSAVATIEACHLEAHTVAAISMNGIGGGHRIALNEIITSVAGAHGIDLSGTGPTSKVTGNTLSGETVAGTQVGINVPGGPNFSIVGNSISGYNTQIVAGSAPGTIVGNVLELSPTIGIRVDTGSASPIVISANTIKNTPAGITNPSGSFALGQNVIAGTVPVTFTPITAFGAGWSQLAGSRGCGYIINPDRTCTLVIQTNSAAAGTTITTLPVAARPTSTIQFTARGDDGVGSSACFGRILSTGVIVADIVRGGAGPTLALSLIHI